YHHYFLVLWLYNNTYFLEFAGRHTLLIPSICERYDESHLLSSHDQHGLLKNIIFHLQLLDFFTQFNQFVFLGRTVILFFKRPRVSILFHPTIKCRWT